MPSGLMLHQRTPVRLKQNDFDQVSQLEGQSTSFDRHFSARGAGQDHSDGHAGVAVERTGFGDLGWGDAAVCELEQHRREETESCGR